MPFVLKIKWEEKYICYKSDCVDITRKKEDAKRFRGMNEAKGCAQFLIWGNDGVLNDYPITDDFEIVPVLPDPKKQRFKR